VRAGLYARVSTTEQAEEGNSLDAQRQAGADFCEGKGWELVDVYMDVGISGASSKRPELQRLLDDAGSGRIDVVVVQAIDRFYRNLQRLLGCLDRLNKAGVGFVSIRENMDFTTPWGKLTLAVLGSLAEVFLDIHGQRVKTGKQYRASQGYTNSAVPVYGYKRVDRCDVIDEKAAAGVRLAFERYATGEYADFEIGRLLTEEGHGPPEGARRAAWNRSTVRFLLMNRYYTGWVKYEDKWYPGEHEAIISQELFDEAQNVRERRGHGGAHGVRTGAAYLLHQVGRCWHCGRYLHMVRDDKRKRVYFYYREPSRSLDHECEAKGRYASMEEIDQQVADLVKRLKLPEDWRERLRELEEQPAERDEVEARRRKLQERKRRLRELYELGDWTLSQYKRRRNRLDQQLEALRIPEAPEVEQAAETLASLGAEWISAPKRYKRDMLRVIFDGIYIDMIERRLVCIKPYPDFAPLFRMDGLEERETGVFYVREEAGSEG
jgi:site-specific DNA recombinase